MAASALLLPLRPFTVSALHTGMMEVTFWCHFYVQLIPLLIDQYGLVLYISIVNWQHSIGRLVG